MRIGRQVTWLLLLPGLAAVVVPEVSSGAVTAAVPIQLGGLALAQQRSVRSPVSTDDSAKPPPLVNADDELAGFLAQAEELVQRKSYDRAIDILQALIDRPDSGFVPGPEGRQYVSLWLKANELLGRMGPEGLKRYQRRFNPSAQQLYEQAVAVWDESALRRVAQRYLWTEYGVLSVEAMAALAFDRGRFVQAEAFWRQALRIRRGTEHEALLLAKVAVASHLAGDADLAARFREELVKKHPKAKAAIGGREQDLAALVDGVTRTPPPPRSGGRHRVEGWPGLGGVPDGLAVMADSKVVLMPRWRVPPPESASGEGSELKLLVGSGLLGRYQPNFAMRPVARKGHVYVTVQRRMGASMQTSGGYYLPPLMEPVVVDDTVICRQDDMIYAYDLLTGQNMWKSAALALETRSNNPAYAAFYSSQGVPLTESGHYGLTVGGGKVFAIYDYATPKMNMNHPFGVRPGGSPEPADSSSIAAISLKRQGALLWKVGGGLGTHDVVRNGKFLTAPTYRAGRLYVIALYLEGYYLACLDAETGGHIWSAMIAQTPAIPRRYGYPIDDWFTRGSAPAVADGMVFGLTNSGAIGAFEAETGRPVWAYQYDSNVNTPQAMHYMGYNMSGALMPPNPLIVTEGNVICLPADSGRTIALSVEDGHLAWQAERGQHRYLNAIDEGRVLVSGKGLVVLSSATGEELFTRSEPDILGRPAVTENAVLASTEVGVIRLEVADYQLKTTPMDTASGLLGNLISVDGKLVAANASGLCAYFDYNFARQALTERLTKAPADERWELQFQRAQMAFNAKHFPEALEDFQACWDGAAADRARRLKLQPWRLRTYVALGNRATPPGKMLELFQKAEECASTEREKAHLKIRIAKYHEKVGQYAQAVMLAHQIAKEFGELEIADVLIGPGADDAARLEADAEKYPAREWASGKDGQSGFIGEVIRRHGRGAYGELDAQAKAAFDQAAAKQDPDALVLVAEQWPHSQWADNARFAAGEIWYRKTAGLKSPTEINLLLQQKVLPQLEKVVATPDSPLRVSAAVALAMIYAQGNQKVAAGQELDPIRDQPPGTPVAFADIKGTLGQLIQEIEGGELPRFGAAPMRFICRIQPPLTDRFTLKGEDVLILRNQDYEPVRLGERILVLRGKRAILLNTAASEVPAEDQWAGMVSVDFNDVSRYLFNPGQGLVCGLSPDQKTLMIADRQAVRGLDIETAKVKWAEKSMADIGISSLAFMATGGGVLVAVDARGEVACLDISTGELKWKATLVGGHPSLPGNAAMNARPTGAPDIAADCVYVRHANNRALTCLDLRTGKVLAKWAAKMSLDIFPTNEGMLAMMTDGEWSVQEIVRNDAGKRTFSEPRIFRYGESSGASILGGCRDRVAISPSRTSSEVRIVPMVRKDTIASFEVQSILGTQAVPVDAYFDGKDVYVVCTTGRFGARRTAYGGLTTVQGLSIEKYDLETKKRVWQKVVDPPQQYTSYLMPLVIGQDHLVVTTKCFSMGMPSLAKILDRKTGKVVGEIDLRGAGSARLRIVGPPVMTNGRLCVEDSQGLTVYGGR